MTETSSILYAKPEERCPRSILRLHNQTFLHAIACEEVFGKPQILTEKKFYGRYLHSLIVHAPIQHRIICLRSTNTEQQERHFNTLSSISSATSSRRPGEIITPGIIRVQAEMKSEENKQRDTVKEQESRLGKLASCLPRAENTIIPHRLLLKYPKAYQAHLERIADFLICGEGIWWRHIVSGVEFLDGPDERKSNDNGPPLHHFRTHTLKSEDQYLKACWKECTTRLDSIPHHTVRIYDEDGNLESVQHTRFLEDASDDGNEDDDDPSDCNNYDGLEEENHYIADIIQHEDEEEEVENIVDLQPVGEDLTECTLNYCEEIPLAEGSLLQQRTESEAVNEVHEATPPETPVEVTAELKTTLAKNVSKVLGKTNEVRKLDKLRTMLRDNLTSKQAQDNYEASLAVVQTQVLAKYSKVKQQFKEWEQNFFAEHDYNEPNLDDIRHDRRGYDFYKTLRLCKQLLQHWDITLHQ